MDFLDTASNFLSVIWNFIVQFFVFLINISSKIGDFFDFIFSVVLEVPYMLLTIFNNLPDFMQTGISIIATGIVLIFVLKIIKLIRDVTI